PPDRPAVTPRYFLRSRWPRSRGAVRTSGRTRRSAPYSGRSWSRSVAGRGRPEARPTVCRHRPEGWTSDRRSWGAGGRARAGRIAWPAGCPSRRGAAGSPPPRPERPRPQTSRRGSSRRPVTTLAHDHGLRVLLQVIGEDPQRAGGPLDLAQRVREVVTQRRIGVQRGIDDGDRLLGLAK